MRFFRKCTPEDAIHGFQEHIDPSVVINPTAIIPKIYCAEEGFFHLGAETIPDSSQNQNVHQTAYGGQSQNHIGKDEIHQSDRQNFLSSSSLSHRPIRSDLLSSNILQSLYKCHIIVDHSRHWMLHLMQLVQLVVCFLYFVILKPLLFGYEKIQFLDSSFVDYLNISKSSTLAVSTFVRSLRRSEECYIRCKSKTRDVWVDDEWERTSGDQVFCAIRCKVQPVPVVLSSSSGEDECVVSAVHYLDKEIKPPPLDNISKNLNNEYYCAILTILDNASHLKSEEEKDVEGAGSTDPTEKFAPKSRLFSIIHFCDSLKRCSRFFIFSVVFNLSRASVSVLGKSREFSNGIDLLYFKAKPNFYKLLAQLNCKCAVARILLLVYGGRTWNVTDCIMRRLDSLKSFATNRFGSRSKSGFSAILLLILLTSMPHIASSFHHNIKYSMNVVKTKYGSLRGVVVRSNPIVEAFLGVPYASPPVGSLRFMPPVTPSTWRTTRLADRFSAVCPQTAPVPPNGPEALLEVPRGRLAQLRRLLPLLANQSEDCLYLNLYVPRTSYPSSAAFPASFSGDSGGGFGMVDHHPLDGSIPGGDKKQQHTDDSFSGGHHKALPVIVYIHGESYEWNSGNPYDGSVLAAHGHIIVVTINFRLGILGFLKTGGKGSAQGNFGLMDLVAGLHWLRENLPAFGGDPDNITLMGHGTGAALANILVVSPVASDKSHPWGAPGELLGIILLMCPLTWEGTGNGEEDDATYMRQLMKISLDLVHRAILLSGSALSPWAIQKDPLFVKRRVAEQTGCHGDMLEDDLAPCLRTKPISELLAVKIDAPRFLPGFAPFIDGTVIVNPSSGAAGPLILPVGSAIASTSGIELADFPSRELIFGLTTIESYLDLSAQDLEFGFNETRRDRILRTYVRNVYHYHLNEIYAALKNEYTDWERPLRNPMGSRDASLEFLSDGHTAAPLIRLGYMHSLRGGKSYFLHFRYQSGERDFPQRAGSVRGEDVPFCLGLPISALFPYNYTKQDVKISKLLIQYLSNFAQTGNPNESPKASVDISRIVHSKSGFVESMSLTSSSSSSASSGSSSAFSLPSSSSSSSSAISPPPTGGMVGGIVPKSVESSPPSSSSSSAVKHITDQYLSQLSPISVLKSSITSASAPPSSLMSSSSISSLLGSGGGEGTGPGAFLVDSSLRTSVKSKPKRHAIAAFRIKRKTVKNSSRKYPENNKTFHRKRYPFKTMAGGSVADQADPNPNPNPDPGNVLRTKQHHHHHLSGSSPSRDGDSSREFSDEDEDDKDEDNEEEDDEINEEDEFDDRDNEDEREEEEEEEGDDDTRTSRETEPKEDVERFDRFDDTSITRLPFWDTYDAINQLYLELGNKVEIRNHYRGHKLSMWLSLIPQLHSPGDLNELPVRHHHFLEENAQYYDGIIRPQIMQRPTFSKVNIQQPLRPRPTTTTSLKIDPAGKQHIGVPATTTECPPNTTVVPTIAATRPQNHQQNGSGPGGVISGPGSGMTNKQGNNNLLRRLATTQYQSYTTALMVTIAVGCFLLLLNILIFAGIYYQREKRANDAKKKEELKEAERCGSPTMEKIRGGCSGGKGSSSSRKSSVQSVTGFNINGSFGEYSCYDEKLQCKEGHPLADICSVELPLKEFKCSSSSPVLSSSGSIRRSSNPQNILKYVPAFHNPQATPHKHQCPQQHHQHQHDQHLEGPNNGVVTYQQYHKQIQQAAAKEPQHSPSPNQNHPNPGPSVDQCNQSTQSEQPTVQDVATSVDEVPVNWNMENNPSGGGPEYGGDGISPGIPEPPPPPKSNVPYQGGILRQPGPPTTPGSNKKRVQIQEISV